ncbi:hypothetical protein [Kitasatospora viridis]|uniref:PH (Pleckstrin Homology) domain-containing protein n=1 Tax=Kitasatospora viridis TaxID=281105 RepID=A0A561UQC1_9ACTN|nr:hypothetical protein [Kitasatospora viridis]TWG01560.1 hypothetical protein FHX73_115461 [Kitasatospora viridis]
MDELVFRKPPRGRRAGAWDKGAVIGLCAIPVLQLAVFGFRAGPLAPLAGVAFAALLVAVVVPISARSWTRVGLDGITISRGSRRGRGYAWHQVRWIEVRERRGRSGWQRTVLITPARGRRRTLPWLVESQLRPDPGFAVSVAELMAWWEANTEASGRTEPVRRLGSALDRWRAVSRLRRLALGAPVLVLLFGVLCAVQTAGDLPGAVRAADRFHAVPRCVGLPPERATDRCYPQYERAVSTVRLADGGRGPSWIGVESAPGDGSSDSWDSADGDTRYSFGALPPALRSVRVGDRVQLVTEPDGSTVVGIEAGGAFAPTEAAADSALGVAQAELIATVVVLAFGVVWLAALLRRPGRRLPWWVPAGLPAVGVLLDVTDARSADPAPLDFGLYQGTLAALAAGLAVGVLLRLAWARRTRWARRS